MFNTASEDEIRGGKTSDIYFQRAREVLEAEGVSKVVKAEFVVKSLPSGHSWGVLAGVEEVASLLIGVEVDCLSVPEGTLFGESQPVLVIEGEYTRFGVLETPILGLLCQASGVATKAARCKLAAGERQLVSFGARRMHPVLTPMIERNAYIGGCDGVAAVKSAELLGIEPAGTMPHALILLLGDSSKAALAFHKAIDRTIPRVVLVDTFGDEVFESLKAAEVLGDDLSAVRLDTPLSRRGDFLQILREVRWELDLRGYGQVKLFVSGGIDEEKILELNPVVDGYGVGTTISNAPVLDFAMDIVEIEGEPIAKRGKPSGGKLFLRCSKCGLTEIVPEKGETGEKCECGGTYENLLKPLISQGKVVRELPPPKEIRGYVLEQLRACKGEM